MSNTISKARATLRAYRELLFERPAPQRVKRFLFSVNGWCNSKCTFCNIWQYDKRKALGEEITLEELERNLFSAQALAGVLDIGITGGEPFLRRDLAALVRAMFAHFPRARIGAVTNGIRHERVVETAAQIAAESPGRTFSIALSLDGYGETHDRVRGVPGNFERVLTCVTQLRERAPAVQLGFSHTVTPVSMQDSLRCYELARELGVGFMYRLAHESPYLRNEGDPIWSPAALAEVRPIVAELNRRMLADQSPAARVGNTHYPQIAFYNRMMDYFEQPRRTSECYSGTHSFLLNHDGEIHPCINMPHSMGNVRRDHFDTLWFGAAADAVRAPIAAWECHCWTNCETEFSLARQAPAFVYGLQLNMASLLPGGRTQLPDAAAREVIPLVPAGGAHGTKHGEQ
jgi:Fe-coproporphyrin III synthase